MPLVIFGAGHDVSPVVQFAKALGCHVTVVDPRCSEASPSRFQAADCVLCQPIVVVLGAQSERIEAEVQQLPTTVIRNSRWAEGVSSSIQTGLKTLQLIDPTIEAVIILLCDQPFVSVSLVHQLIEEYDRTGKLIVASEYADTLGVPALFSHALFPVLMTLQADRGARVRDPKSHSSCRSCTVSIRCS